MTRIRVVTLLGLAGLGLVLGWSLEAFLVSRSLPVAVPPYVAAITAVVIGGVVVAVAWPIRAAVRGRGPRVDPFHALRVLSLAKACALVGALLAGALAGVLAFLLTRSVVALALVAPAAAGLAGAVLLVAAGLVAESFCVIPPTDDDDDRAAAGRG